MYHTDWKSGTSTVRQPDIETINWDLLLPETVNQKIPVVSSRLDVEYIASNTEEKERTLYGCYTCDQ